VAVELWLTLVRSFSVVQVMRDRSGRELRRS